MADFDVAETLVETLAGEFKGQIGDADVAEVLASQVANKLLTTLEAAGLTIVTIDEADSLDDEAGDDTAVVRAAKIVEDLGAILSGAPRS
jgi:hypothetical protein